MSKIFSTLVVAATAATAVTVLGAAPAQAGISNVAVHRLVNHVVCDQNNLRGRGAFDHATDDVRSADHCKDGWGPEVLLQMENGASRSCYNQGGNGTVLPCPYNFPEYLGGLMMVRSLNDWSFVDSGNPVIIEA
ncbi:MAG TPA: hypothetical protein VMF51_09695 [Nocardioides sp.]|uniref:hypothetical protein n=1 Tax=Nocardioides sp. TaxID=35761 RepID=UPI002C9D36D6|nr:hypothetical protein [Nocardioides sp.]HTW15394.1 hypothetical protein [Nocardioides sp.]